MKKHASLLVVVLLGLLSASCSRQNQALFVYLGDPVPPPANMAATYSKGGLLNAVQDAAQAANVSLVTVEVDDSEFPFLVGVVCAQQGDVEKLREQIGTVAAYSFSGSVGGDTSCAMNLVPYSVFPADASQRIHRRMTLRMSMLYDQINGKQ